MTRIFCLLLLLVIWSVPANAQGVILSGEHGDFTRVVIPIGEERTYSIAQDGEDRRVVVLDPPGSFDTQRVFDILNADRLQGLESSGDVGLDLGCDCEIRGFRYLDEYLVIDIFDTDNYPGDLPDYPQFAQADAAIDPNAETTEIAGPVVLPSDAPTIARAMSAREAYRPQDPLSRRLLRTQGVVVSQLAALDAPQPGAMMNNDLDPMAMDTPQAPQPDERALARADQADMQNPTIALDGAETPGMPPAMAQTDPMVAAMEHEDAAHGSPDMALASDPMGMAETEPASGFDEAVDTLAQQLARAAAAGLLETSAMTPTTQLEANLDDPMAEDLPDDTSQGDPPETGLPVRAANAFDVASDRDSGLAAIAAALSCAQPIGDLSNWLQGFDFDSGLGEMRQSAFDADGNLLRGPVINLARHYIFHGFGAEAEGWLLQLDDPPEVELAMARYLDDRPGPNFSPVETLALCSGLDLLWRFVDAPDFPELAVSQRQEMRLAFSGLPLGLRRLIGPDFVRQLDAAGYGDDAAEIREALARGPVLDETEVMVLEFETADGPPTRSETEALARQLETAGPDAARVMREYLAALRRAGDVPNESRMIAADALLREIPPDQSLGSLWHEILMAKAGLGEIETAFAMLDDLANASSQTRDAIEADIAGAILRSRETAALVVFSGRLATQPEGHNLPRNQRNAIFQELSDLGLQDLAEPFRTSDNPMEQVPPPPGQNWAAAAAGTEGSAAAVARRVAELENAPGPFNMDNPDDVRGAVADSRALRAELSDLLGVLPNN